jgi:hypothetical protein
VRARLWFPRDAQLCADPRIQELGYEHGPAAVTVFEEVLALAKLQDENARVDSTFVVLAQRAFTKPRTARAILEQACDLGLFERHDMTPRAFAVSVAAWSAWNPKDPGAAERQRRSRASRRDPARDSRDMSVTNAVTVTPPHIHGEANASPTPTPGVGNRDSDDPTIQQVLDVLAQCDRLYVDVMGVENAVLAWPGRDPVRAARTVVTWATDPAFQLTNAARALEKALSKQPDPPPEGTGRTARQRKADDLAALNSLIGEAA